MPTAEEQLVAARFTQDEKTGVYMGFYKKLPDELVQQLAAAHIHFTTDGAISVLTVDKAHAGQAAALATKLTPYSIADNELDKYATAIFKLVGDASNKRLTDAEGKAAQSVLAEFAAGYHAAQEQDKAANTPMQNVYKHIAKYQKLLGDDATAVDINYTLNQILPLAKQAVITQAIQADAALNDKEKEVAGKLASMIGVAQARGTTSALDAFAQTDPRTQKVYDEVKKLMAASKDKIPAQIEAEAELVTRSPITDDALFKAVRDHLGRQADAQGVPAAPQGAPAVTPAAPAGQAPVVPGK